MGWAALVGVLCATILVGLGLVRGTAPMAGVAHSERGPSSFSAGTSTASPSTTLTSDPEPSDIALSGSSPRGTSRGLGGLPAAPLVTLADPQAVVSGVVRQGAFCARAAVAQIGYTSSGTEMICSYGDGEDQPRWRAIYVEQAEPTTKKPSAAEPTDEEPPDEESEDEESTTAKPTTAAPPTTISKPPNTSTFRPDS
jgi:hypothetical protein